jgi:hypothetical protein
MLLFYFLQSRPIIVTEVVSFSRIFHKTLLRDHTVSGAGVKECGIEMSNGVTGVSGFVEIRQLVSKLRRGGGLRPHARPRARAHTHTHMVI